MGESEGLRPTSFDPAFDKMSEPVPWDAPPASIGTALRFLLWFQIRHKMAQCLRGGRGSELAYDDGNVARGDKV